MLDVYQRAIQARQLAEYEPFRTICDEIKDDAVKLFSNPASGIDQIARAHEAIRAVDMFTSAIKARIDAETIADKKDRHRAND